MWTSELIRSLNVFKASWKDKMNKEKLLQKITIDPKIMLGKPVIKGTRLTVEIIIEKMAYGATLKD